MTVGAYLRVSTRGQSLETQRHALVQAADARGLEISEYFEDVTSGTSKLRPGLTRLLARSAAGQLHMCLVYRLDRLSRSGIVELSRLMADLRSNGTEVVSIADGFSWAGEQADLVIAILAWAAKVELVALGERIAAARVRVAAQGGHWGRPRRVPALQAAQIRAMAAGGKSLRYIAQALRIPKSTVGAVASGKPPYDDPPETTSQYD